MSPFFILPIASALLAAAATWFVFDGRHDAEMLKQKGKYERKVAQLEADAKQLQLDSAAARTHFLTRLQEQTHAAEQAARTREDRLRRDLAAARGESDGLRDQLSDAARRIADAPPAATAEYALALGELFADCSRSYQELAGKADGHASDVQHHRDRWPRNAAAGVKF